MLKKILKLIKKNDLTEDVSIPLDNEKEEVEDIEVKSNEESKEIDCNDSIAIAIEEDFEIECISENQNIGDVLIDISNKIDSSIDENIADENKVDGLAEISIDSLDIVDNLLKDYGKEDVEEQEEEQHDEIIENDEDDSIDIDKDNSIELELIKEIKIKREKSIKVIDLYTQEEQIFNTHKECSRKLKIPLGYIKENLKYGYTDYLGEAIKYLSKELNSGEVSDDGFDYLNNSKNPMELYNTLNNRIFTSRISEKKRDVILSSDKIEPIKMHYRFECLDEEYDDYFMKYKSIIQRGGKKKIELIDKKGEAIEVFKSLDDCATYLGKEKSEVVDMLKYGNTKVGRYEIRYSLRNI